MSRFIEFKIWILKVLFKMFFIKDRWLRMKYLEFKLGLIFPEELEREIERKIILDKNI